MIEDFVFFALSRRAVHDDAAGDRAIGAGVARLRRALQLEGADVGRRLRRRETQRGHCRPAERRTADFEELPPVDVHHVHDVVASWHRAAPGLATRRRPKVPQSIVFLIDYNKFRSVGFGVKTIRDREAPDEGQPFDEIGLIGRPFASAKLTRRSCSRYTLEEDADSVDLQMKQAPEKLNATWSWSAAAIAMSKCCGSSRCSRRPMSA